MSTMTEGDWRGEVTTDGDERWHTNTLRFPTRDAALEYVSRLARRWILVTRWRAVDGSMPFDQAYEPGSQDGEW
jgi:hypothetical protein